MNLHDLHELQNVHTYPCLTITLPTHRTSPDNKQDPIRVKNLVTEGTNRLLGEFSKREVAPLIQGGGGGKPTLAEAGGKKPEAVREALTAAQEAVLAKIA